MNKKARYPAGIMILTGFTVFLLARCVSADKKETARNDSFANYAGSTTCVNCHKEVYEQHKTTGHYLSSQPASGSLIAGNLNPPGNYYAVSLADTVFMQKRGDSFFQTEQIMGKPVHTGRMDIVVGSGKKGQSYLSWKQNSLVQLPVTYFTPARAWSSSPGFNPHQPVFNRVVTSRCLECHSTFFERTSPEGKHPEAYSKTNIIFGVDCERCHGPAREHVVYHSEHPAEKTAKYIVNTGKLSRQLQLDLCALCHSGKLNKTQPSFSYKAGDPLLHYFERPNLPPAPGGSDVHGNQLGMLSDSRCFQQSEMTCQSCHDPHKKEQNLPAVYASRCQQCHQTGKSPECPLLKTEGEIIKTNCIDCHMPLQPSQSITVFLPESDVPLAAKLRNHTVAVYKDESAKVLQYLRANGKNEK